jgi:hypothetical protein
MGITVERIPGEPILVATLSGDVTADHVRSMFERSAKLAEQIEGRVYRITDLSAIKTKFSDLVEALAQASKGQPGSSSDPRFCAVIVGDNQWSRMYSEGLKQEQYGKYNIPLVSSLEDAMDYIREQQKIVK